MRCLFGIRDDLHAYAERMHARRRALMARRPITSRDYGPVRSVVVHRDGAFQTEFFTVAPGTIIPAHRHPGVDSIECPVEGFIRFVIDGTDPYEGISNDRLERFALGKLVRIDAKAWHSGVAGPDGSGFLSMQRWPAGGPLAMIGERWEGQTVSDKHETLAQAARTTHEFVPLTAEIAQAFYGFAPTSTVRGYALLQNGRALIVMGIRRAPLGWLLFSDAKEEARQGTFATRRLVVLGARKIVALLHQTKAPVMALADERFAGTRELLEHLGFEQLEGRVYRWLR